MEKYFELCNNKRKISKILKEYEEGQPLLYDDDTELCYYREGNFSMYLAVYDEELTWTFSDHFDANDFENVGEIYFKPHKKDFTIRDLEELCKIILPIAKNWYVEQGGYSFLNSMPFIQLEGIVEVELNKLREEQKQKTVIEDIYDKKYDYDDICIIVTIMDFIEQYDTDLDTKLNDVEDIVNLSKTIKEEWLKEFKNLTNEQQGYVGAYAHQYLRETYL